MCGVTDWARWMVFWQNFQMWSWAPRVRKVVLAACFLLLALWSWAHIHPSMSSAPLIPPPVPMSHAQWSPQPYNNSRRQLSSQADQHDGQDVAGNQTRAGVSGELPRGEVRSSHGNQSLSVVRDGPQQGKVTSTLRTPMEALTHGGGRAEMMSVGEEGVAAYNGNILRDMPPKQGLRFLIFECVDGHGQCGGWGDRQEGLVTVFLLAFLTHRRFGIRMTTPCDVTKFVVPNHYDWTVPDAEIQGKPTRRVHAIDGTKFSREMSTMDFNAKFPEDVVFLQTNRDLLKDITENPHYRDVLPPWARQARPQFFRDVWRTLMKPSAELRQRVESLLLHALHYANRTEPLVGLHVRTGASKNFADENFGNRLSHLDPLWRFVQPYVDNGSDVFVATDNPEVVQASRARFGSHHHDAQAVLRHIDRQRQDPAICRALGGAILDQLILTRCDVLVVSPGSGFSSRAAMIRGSNRQLFNWGKERVSPADMYKMCEPIC